ncbi:4Fe-4S dicluster domain-containing protein [Thermodesulforhabdus norvegica]|uniref:Carbon-monoxide dehydrogenase iron sulfur subunit n=1 Tax=Thermodesulforhabdus norvegica TaxID=39841 RepID=A0A1I4TPQ9_9BACT|nr:4Fe-4S dicluster domain-containing protein [Thermodesulforhabdus norvegica]SFM78547.1 carbon-monoxide dehydrogenase iron sulfur subunit [Thermodesulforhabdus norvegica]
MKEIFVRFERCVGCRSCELACAVEHSQSKNLYAAVGETPRPRRRVFVEYIEGRKLPFLCRHCEDAPCVGACRTGALNQDPITRIVSHNPDRCIGCWLCSMVCPYGVINREAERRIAVKCDRCPERVTPACVEACPTGALVFTEETDFESLRRKESLKSAVRGLEQ